MRIILHHNRRPRVDQLYSIEYEVYLTRTDRMFISTKVVIESKYWDMKTKLVKHTHPEFIAMNAKIKRLKDRLDEIDQKYALIDEPLTGKLLRFELSNSNTSTTINEYMAEQIEIDRPDVAKSTYKKWVSVLNNLNLFGQVPLTRLDSDFVRKYHNHLLKTMKRSTTGKNHKILVKYILRAIRSGLVKNNPYTNFTIPRDAERIIYLTPVELEKIRNKSFSNTRLEIIKDMFLFMCNTALEYIDMVNLRVEDIVTVNGNKYLIKSRKKANTEIYRIPLFEEAIEIINKYAPFSGNIFPLRSNQKVNEYLKEVAALCEIEKNLTSIIARHTFGTLMLSRGVPLETLSHIMGHSSIRTTRIYAKFVVAKIENDLTRLGIDRVE